MSALYRAECKKILIIIAELVLLLQLKERLHLVIWYEIDGALLPSCSICCRACCNPSDSSVLPLGEISLKL